MNYCERDHHIFLSGSDHCACGAYTNKGSELEKMVPADTTEGSELVKHLIKKCRVAPNAQVTLTRDEILALSNVVSFTVVLRSGELSKVLTVSDFRL